MNVIENAFGLNNNSIQQLIVPRYRFEDFNKEMNERQINFLIFPLSDDDIICFF